MRKIPENNNKQPYVVKEFIKCNKDMYKDGNIACKQTRDKYSFSVTVYCLKYK